ncbi:adenylate/guanylate cyclase domain-containing protein [filamentous cyanobacterium LEGE 11480]|uniref:Adenylate/guanylate cyclase domain-containing protein n=2 Tax=Romeriopsis TaxID=2992131 RepID=A0A928VS86_9CYAN|nr:adenylate/guanylate cyclase domain-containing protein [Romeriopsis navalis LEGE 11480]
MLDSGNCWMVGRSDDSDFVITDRWISRNHAMLQAMDNGEMYLIDLGSRNGSFVNGRRVGIPVTLKNGDRLTFGQTELLFNSPRTAVTAPGNKPARELTATAALHVRRLISVLVVDIRDYTVLTRQMDEQVMSEMIGSWFRQAGEIIRNNGSWVDKYIGDAVMAVWIHGSQETASPKEIQPALQVVQELYEMTQALADSYPVPFPLRIGAGLNTGFAMVGNTGSGDRPDYTALGDTVNAAFRLESSTKQARLDVMMGSLTQQCANPNGEFSQFFQPKSVRLKGYDEPYSAYGCSFDELSNCLKMMDLEKPKSTSSLG